MGILTREQIRELIREKNLVTAEDAQNMLKEMFAETLQEMLEAELETELGYPKNGSKPNRMENRRNGHTSKKVRSSFGELDLSVPRDRVGEFEPVVVKKRQKEVAGIEEQIIALYAKGVTVRDIQAHLNQLYGVDVSPTLISKCNEQDHATDPGLAIAAAAKGVRGGVSGRHPFQGKAGRSYCE